MAKTTEDIRPVSDLETHAGELVDLARSSQRPVVLTQQGHRVAVLLDLEEYEALVEHKRFAEAVEQGAEAARADDLFPHAEAQKILASFGE